MNQSVLRESVWNMLRQVQRKKPSCRQALCPLSLDYCILRWTFRASLVNGWLVRWRYTMTQCPHLQGAWGLTYLLDVTVEHIALELRIWNWPISQFINYFLIIIVNEQRKVGHKVYHWKTLFCSIWSSAPWVFQDTSNWQFYSYLLKFSRDYYIEYKFAIMSIYEFWEFKTIPPEAAFSFRAAFP